MPVVINDFEVVADQPSQPDRSAPSSGSSSAASPRGATPHEIELILQREKERLARVQAH
jgi:hypothetical protein